MDMRLQRGDLGLLVSAVLAVIDRISDMVDAIDTGTDFPDGGDSFGVEAAYNASGPLAVFGGYNLLTLARELRSSYRGRRREDRLDVSAAAGDGVAGHAGGGRRVSGEPSRRLA